MICILGACILAAQLTGGGLYHEDTPTEVTYNHYTDTTLAVYETTTQDISKMYEATNIQFIAAGYMILDTDTRIDLKYDNGLESEKRSRGKSLTIGITQLKVLSEDTHMTFGISTRLGGKIEDRKCHDTLGLRLMRYCETAQLWSLRPDNSIKRDVKTSLTFNHKFNWFLGTKETINKE